MDTDDERMRALLARAGEPGPPLGITAAAIARRGRRIRLVRWGAGAGGLVVVAAGVTLSLLYVNTRPVQPASPPPVANTVTATATVTTTTLDTPTTTSHYFPTTTDTVTDTTTTP